MILKTFLTQQRNYSIGKVAAPPRTFILEGLMIRRPVDIAEYQMKYFSEKVNTLINNLPTSPTNPLKWIREAKLNWRQDVIMDKFKFKEINLLQTIKLIGGLGNSTSAGIVNIDALAIKAAAVPLAPPLMHLVNTSTEDFSPSSNLLS